MRGRRRYFFFGAIKELPDAKRARDKDDQEDAERTGTFVSVRIQIFLRHISPQSKGKGPQQSTKYVFADIGKKGVRW